MNYNILKKKIEQIKFEIILLIKKKYIVISILLFSFNAFSQGSFKGRVIYNISYKKPNLEEYKKKKNDEEVRSRVIDMYNNTKDVKSTLLFNRYESLFKLEKKMSKSNKSEMNLTQFFAGNNEVNYYNLNDQNIITQKELMGDYFLISKKQKKWILTKETKKIGKYLCYKAEFLYKGGKPKRVKKIIAWFTEEIPISFGPRNYAGLPGLILELEDSKLIYKAIKVELGLKEKLKIEKPSKGKKISEENYLKFVKSISPF